MKDSDPHGAIASARDELAKELRRVADFPPAPNYPGAVGDSKIVAAALRNVADFVERLSENDPCIMAIAASWELPHGVLAYTVMTRPIVSSHGLKGESPRCLLVSLGEVAVSLILPPKEEAA